MINHESEHLDYCKTIVEKLSKGESLPIALNMNGFSLTLHQLVQSYYSSDLRQSDKIKGVLKRSVDMLWKYLMPLDLSKEDNSILPAAFEGNDIITTNKISFHEGELQIALLLIKIAIILEDKHLFKAANLVAAFSKIKEDKIEVSTLTFDLKNGTIGIALLYQTIYFLTNESLYLERANYWFVKSEDLMNSFLRENDDVHNRIEEKTMFAFEAFKNPQNTTWRKENFLEFDTFLGKNF